MRRNVIGTTVALVALTAAGRAHADGNGDDVASLEALLSDNVVSGASKDAETSSDAPATTTTLTAEDIRRYGIRTLDEAIDFLGMGMVTQNPLHSAEVGARGVLLTADFGNHVLLVVDGHVVNEPWNGTAAFDQGAAIPMELIDHVELILGPGSVLYGGNAMLGVVNVVTKKASALHGVYVVAEGSASPQQGVGGKFTSFAPANLGTTGRVGVGVGHTFDLLGKPLEWTGQVEMYGSNGPSFAWAPETVNNHDGTPVNFGPRSPLGVWGGRTTRSYWSSVPALYTRLEWGNFSLMFRMFSYGRATPYENNANQLGSDFDARSRELDRTASIDLQHRTRFGKWSTLAHAYADDHGYDERMYETDPHACAFIGVTGKCETHGVGRSRWVGLEGQATYDWLGDGNLTTMAGLDGRVRYIGETTDYSDVNTGRFAGALGKGSVTELAYAAYAQQRWTPVKELHLNVGARFDHDPRGGDKLSPRAAIAYNPWRDSTLKAIYAEAFRAPSYYEKYYADDTKLQSPNLQSEVERSAEGTFEQRFGRQRLLVGVYRSWWLNVIQRNTLPDGVTTQYQNTAKIDNWGFNARFDGATGNFAYGISATGARAMLNDAAADHHELTVTPQIFGNARVAYDLPGALPTVALAATFVGQRAADRAFDGHFPTTPYAPAQGRFRLTVSDSIKAVPGLSWRVFGEIVTNGASPYVAGPVQAYDPTMSAQTTAQLAPVNRMTAFASLHYEIPGL